MKIVHTSDWHVGRRWRGVQRHEEMAKVLEQLAGFIEREAIDLVLHTGDVFDSRNPPAEAEALVNGFIVRVGRAGARMVMIAGNHDDPQRLDARSLLAEYAGVQIIGRPRSAQQGGTLVVETSGGERAVIAALPFASAGKWISALELAESEAAARIEYAHMFGEAVKKLSGGFQAGAVNLFMAHTHLQGAIFGESERRVHIGEDWAGTTQKLPGSASYIALGHIHKPQRVSDTLPAYYAGSPLQMDFGEAGQEKSFVVVAASPGRPARIEHVPYEGGLPLVDLRATLPELERLAQEPQPARWLRVTVPLAEPDPDLNRKVRELLPNVMMVWPDLPEIEAMPAISLVKGASAEEQYAAYHVQAHGAAPSGALAAAFHQLHQEASDQEG